MSLMNRVTKCCSSEVVRHHGREYPDGRTFFIATSYDACSQCNEPWPDAWYSCDYCGSGADSLTETKLGMYCHSCVLQHSEELMEKA